MKTIVKNIIEYFNKNTDLFIDCIEELDDDNGYLGNDRYHEMNRLNETLSNKTPIEILQSGLRGRDNVTWTSNKHCEYVCNKFNLNRKYFLLNEDNQLISSDEKDYSHYLNEDTVIEMNEHRMWIFSINFDRELCHLFDELDDKLTNQKENKKQNTIKKN